MQLEWSAITRRSACRGVCAAAAILGLSATARAAITEAQTLVVYNSASADGTTLKNAYLAAHPGIPAANVVNLNNAALLTDTITYAQFVSLVRDPIRTYLNLPAAPSPSDIIAIALIRPFPHRIYDTDNVVVGDNPGGLATEFSSPLQGGFADATCASVDSELTLLWQNLDVGEAGGPMDSKSDNIIDNPYHQAVGQIQGFTRANIQVQKVFTNTADICWLLGGTGATRLMNGDIYLVCRIDGNSLADATAGLARAQSLYINKATVRILLDEYDLSNSPPPPDTDDLDDDQIFTGGDPFTAGDDYEETRNVLVANGWDVRYDATANFIDSTEETLPLIGYASYGENHSLLGLGENPPGAGTYIDNFNFPPGAMFNTIESYNARALNGLTTAFDQEQVADFIAAGGTFGIGMVWEPFSFTIPDNEFMMLRMLQVPPIAGFTWAEAAYASIPCLSWHHVVLGDPLAKPIILNDPATPTGDLNGNGNVDGPDIKWFVDIVLNGTAAYRIAFPTLDPIARGDFNGDFQVTTADQLAFTAALLVGS